MVVLPYSVIYYIYISGTLNFVSIICVQSIDVQSMVFANDRIHYGLQVVFVCLQITPSHYHHYADSSEGIEQIKCFRYICCRVCVLDWDYSRNNLSFNIWGCVSSAYPIRLTWLWECVLYLIIIIKSEVWIINHCLGLGHETMVCAVCLTMFLWICDMTRLLRGTFHVLVVFAPNLVLCHLACSITILLATLLTIDS